MRLIDADALGMAVLGGLTIVSPGVVQYANGVMNLIASAPTIEVEPVRHGRWEEYQVPHIVCCSECDWGTGVQDKYNYCPNCGAKMDGGGNDQT